jgi:hypothetical protein
VGVSSRGVSRRTVPDQTFMRGVLHERFPVARRRVCLPVTSARLRKDQRSLPARAVAQQSGVGVSPGRRASLSVDLIIKRIKE